MVLLCIGKPQIPSDLPEAKPWRTAATLGTEHAGRKAAVVSVSAFDHAEKGTSVGR